jgi:hypothetical protein
MIMELLPVIAGREPAIRLGTAQYVSEREGRVKPGHDKTTRYRQSGR